MKDLKNKLVFITGAGSGIGFETCIAFAKEGCRIIATDINIEGLNILANEVSQLNQVIYTYELNVVDRNAYSNLVENIIHKHGCPDIVFNNAGVAFLSRLEETTEATWNKTIQVNIMGVVNGCQLFLDKMRSKQSPSYLVNMSSIASKTPFPFQSAYVASKWAVEGFTDAIRTELALEYSNIKVMSVHPGLINTNLLPTGHLTFTAKQIANLNAKYQNDGSPPNVVANDIVKAIKKGKCMVMTGTKAKAGYWANKVLPKSILAKLAANDVIKAGLTE
ncbi:SDR family NAD(P)-dependent oxidoreductase [Alteromonas portus]|uniref:SDR family NAD(P)-dependent oxidoreductase n=1 Tax=Alteromonas portus TaxID=2565549 RepID=A0A4U0Z9T3_9ALTE|nr:SDR family NAD(P)-dependent oxidoreductase [Alteromonas portus]TKB00728.1 SDR family NAD(P)-dependent oxidoreductase [Alteromonas portus]